MSTPAPAAMMPATISFGIGTNHASTAPSSSVLPPMTPLRIASQSSIGETLDLHRGILKKSCERHL